MIWLIARKIRQPLTTGMMSLLVLFRSFWASRFYDTSVHTTKNRSPKGAYVIPSVKCLLRHAGEKIYQIVGELLQSEQHLEGGSFVYTEPQRGEQHEHFPGDQNRCRTHMLSDFKKVIRTARQWKGQEEQGTT